MLILDTFVKRPTQADISLLSLFCASHHRSSSFTSFYYNTLFIVVLTHLTRSTHLIPAHFASVCLSCPVCLYSAARARLYLCSSSVSLFSSLAFSIRNNNLVQQPGNHLIRSSKHLPTYVPSYSLRSPSSSSISPLGISNRISTSSQPSSAPF
ncbi:hypothetical protein PCANC_06700 [Puccinia coronata f. sp. avenae]|uniref:Uncharacterized protein n=1 Tax=Puccinia coronata f. sp. avenae TaxID=200324 RepID=A0A2N5VUC2_9BASI|nr:hypothetical protein PCANC_14810 [Puccinia coronata f. sp. avenae]PLW53587.1 hypothetical protein PCANC_06700 [Puccinia coronata f. sp. avenae]